MSETNDSSARGSGKTLSLKKTETSTVKQSFSHGRTKAVVVEKKRARLTPGGGPEAPEKAKSPATEVRTPTLAAPVPARELQGRAGVVLRQLTDEEKEARSRALTDA